jgi:hypothetical protein
VKNARTLITFVGTAFAGRTALKRALQARQDQDLLELLDALLNVAVVVTGVLVIVRRLRRGEEEA